jgi:4a-hydroxytetrahydrobiopterin dehydratase
MTTSASELARRHCVHREKGTPPLTESEAKGYLAQTPQWEMLRGKSLRRRFQFKDFAEAMTFVNRIAAIAEEEDHHPDILISYSRVRIDVTTHSVDGLSENDFILAAKIDQIPTS